MDGVTPSYEDYIPKKYSYRISSWSVLSFSVTLFSFFISFFNVEPSIFGLEWFRPWFELIKIISFIASGYYIGVAIGASSKEVKWPSVSEKIVTERKNINRLSKALLQTNFFKDNEEAIQDISKECTDKMSFSYRIQALHLLISLIEQDRIIEIFHIKKQDDKDLGSITVIELALEQLKPDYDKAIISNIRDITKLRSKGYPVHPDDPAFLDVCRKWRCSYSDYPKLWGMTLEKYIFSLNGIRVILEQGLPSTFQAHKVTKKELELSDKIQLTEAVEVTKTTPIIGAIRHKEKTRAALTLSDIESPQQKETILEEIAPEHLESILKNLKDGNSDVKIDVLKELNFLSYRKAVPDSKRIFPQLLELLHSENPEVQYYSLNYLQSLLREKKGEITKTQNELLNAILQLAKSNQTHNVKHAAIFFLLRCSNNDLIPVLVDALIKSNENESMNYLNYFSGFNIENQLFKDKIQEDLRAELNKDHPQNIKQRIHTALDKLRQG